MSDENQAGPSDGVFRAKEGYVYQIPTLPLMQDKINPITGSVYADTLLATQNGVTAKNAFVFHTGKHPSRNIFAFYRKDIGDIVFDLEEWDHESVVIIASQEWMERTEEDALAEIEARAADPSTEVEELILESLLGLR